MKLFILGAGASKAYEQSKTKVRMPIACDFFDTFDQLEISKSLWVLQGQINLYALEKYNVDSYSYFRSGIDIEDFHSSIEADITKEKLKGNTNQSDFNQMAYNELVYLFSSVINEIQNGPISKPHLKLVENIEAEDVIVTFNWDTLIERALSETGDWNCDSGYGFNPKSIYRNKWETSILKQPPSSIQVLKLHGSTNWLTVHPSLMNGFTTLNKHVKPDDVYIYEYTEEPYSCHRGRFMDGYERMSYGYYPVNLDMVARMSDGQEMALIDQPKPHVEEGTASRGGVPSIPLIIPPEKDKNNDNYGSLFDSLWEKTSESITDADEIIIIGYSFPKTDIKSTNLFLDALSKRSNKPKIKILDPNPSAIVDKFIYEFGFLPSEIDVYQDYFSAEFDIASLIKK
jgi:hypothetical protein